MFNEISPILIAVPEMSRRNSGPKAFLSKILPRCFGIPAGFQSDLLKNFEESLNERLHHLEPGNRNDVISISWMTKAIDSLCETHNAVKSLATGLHFPSSDWDEGLMDSYLSDSSKLLDICNSMTSAVSRLVEGQLLLQCAIRILNDSDPPPSSDLQSRARDSISEWLHQGGSKGLGSVTSRRGKSEKCLDELHDLVDTLHAPKIKTSDKGRILSRALYGLKVQTILVCGALVAAFSGSTEALHDLQVPENFVWSSTFMDVQNQINGEIRSSLEEESLPVLKDLEAVDDRARELLALTEISPELFGSDDAETLKHVVTDLTKKVEGFARGLDVLTKKVDGLFCIVLHGRDSAMLYLQLRHFN